MPSRKYTDADIREEVHVSVSTAVLWEHRQINVYAHLLGVSAGTLSLCKPDFLLTYNSPGLIPLYIL